MSVPPRSGLAPSGPQAGDPPKSVLVLGGTGFIGRAIVRNFLDTDACVRAVARSSRTEASLGLSPSPSLELIEGDAADPVVLEAVLEGIDRVVYAVGQSLPRESNQHPAHDVVAALPPLLALLEALRHAEGVALTYLSSGGTVYGNPAALPVAESAPCEPITGYGITKLAAEKYIGMYARLHGIESTILRVSNAYGPGQVPGRSQGVVASLMDCIVRGDVASLYGDSIRDYVYVDDLASAVVQLSRMQTPLVVNLGSGVGHTLGEVVRAVESAAGSRLRREQLPAREFDVREIVLDVSRLGSLIPWSPRSLEAGVLETWSVFGAAPRAANG